MDNLKDIKELGIQDVVSSKVQSFKISDINRSFYVYRKLHKNFRIGIKAAAEQVYFALLAISSPES